MSLDSIINVTVSAQTASLTRTGFGTPLVVGYHSHGTERVRYFTQLAELVTAGFETDDAIYQAARAILSQNPRPPRIAVGRLTTANTQIVEITPVAKNTHLYSVTINGTEFSDTSDGSATATEIVTLLKTVINAGSEPVTASGTSTLILTADAAGTPFSLEVDYADLQPQDKTLDTCDIAQQLADISLEDDTWYGVTLVDRGAAIIENAAEYLETVKKIGVFNSIDYDILGSGSSDIASTLAAAEYARSAIIFCRAENAEDFSAAAWLGNQLPKDPGSSTWKFKTLASVTPDTFPDASQIVHLEAKSCNYYTTIAGAGITQQGVTASGEFIDTTVFLDWLQVRMQERLLLVFKNNDKVAFTAGGIQLIANQVNAQLLEGVRVGGLENDDVLAVTVPKIADIDPADKADRILRGVNFFATLAGAVHSLVINGTVLV